MKTKLIHYAIIALLVAIIIVMRECDTPNPMPEPITIITSDTVTDTVRVNVTVIKPVPVYIHDSIPVNVNVDTAAILADYFLVRDYSIKFIDDTTANLTLKAKVHKNELLETKMIGKVFNKVIHTNTTTIVMEEPRIKIYAGLQLNAGIDLLGVAPSILYQTKKDHIYSIAYDPFNKIGYGTTWFKINLRKNKRR